jgi:hypothetical protein
VAELLAACSMQVFGSPHPIPPNAAEPWEMVYIFARAIISESSTSVSEIWELEKFCISDLALAVHEAVFSFVCCMHAYIRSDVISRLLSRIVEFILSDLSIKPNAEVLIV